MGFFSGEIRREFIARPDQAKGQILYKWPDTNIRKLTQLTVEQDELAVFFRDGHEVSQVPEFHVGASMAKEGAPRVVSVLSLVQPAELVELL